MHVGHHIYDISEKFNRTADCYANHVGKGMFNGGKLTKAGDASQLEFSKVHIPEKKVK